MRARLELRRDPYWQRLSEGRHVGFRRMTRGAPGTWLARFNNGEGYDYETLGDFATLPENERYDAAKKAAETWFQHLDMGGSTEPSSVKAACEAYVDKLKEENSQAASDDAKWRFQRLVYDDPIAKVQVAKLTTRHVADWKKRALGKVAKRISFDREASSLRAALNLALRRREVASDHAWREELKPLVKNGEKKRRELYLDRAERTKLIENASPEGRQFLTTLCLLPMRPGDPPSCSSSIST